MQKNRAFIGLVLALMLGLGASLGAWRPGHESVSFSLSHTHIGSQAVPTAQHNVGLSAIDSAAVEGHRVCFDCHQAETEAWQRSKHNTSVFKLLRGEAAEKYATAMDIPISEITSNSICVACHGTPQQDLHGRANPIAGVSCEACHNPSGGESGWLNAHAVYGPIGTRREMETDQHFQMRADRCRTAGQIRSSDLYEMVKRCYDCHLVGDEKLVNTANHNLSDTGFEPLNEMLGDVRHNFHLNQHNNALFATLWMNDPSNLKMENRKKVIYTVGQLVFAEAILRCAATVKEPDENYATGLGELLLTAYDELADLESAADFIDDLEELGGQIADGDLDIDDTGPLIEIADKIAIIAKQIATSDGSNLQDVDAPEIEEEQLKKAYQR